MEKFLKQYFWTVNLITIAACSYFSAKTSNIFLAAELSNTLETASANSAAASAKQTPVKAPTAPKENLTPVRKSSINPFTGEEMDPVAPVEEVPAEEALPPPPITDPSKFTKETPCSASSLTGQLIGTVVSSNAKSSFAIISGLDPIRNLYEIGQEIQPGVTLVAVVYHQIFISSQGKLECLWFPGEAPQKQKEIKTEAAPAADTGDNNIRKVSETEYIIAESEITKALENMNTLATQARIVPSFKNGQANGFRIYSIKPGSLFQKIGLQNGDIIQQINGMDINSPEKALEIYSKLRTEKRISLNLIRRGATVTVEYTIQ